jgi:ATP/ADP translocase
MSNDAAGGGRMVMVVVIQRGKTQIQHLIRKEAWFDICKEKLQMPLQEEMKLP